jgi:preprotein translocase subunit SecD
MRGQKWRIGITILIIIVAVLAYRQTFKLWMMSDEEKQQMQEKSPDELLTLEQKAIRLGLDLQGGIHVVLRVKTEEIDPASRDGAVERAIQIIRNRIDGLGVAEPVIQKQGRERIIVDLPGYTDEERAEDLIGQTALLEFKMLENFENAQLLIAKMDSVIQQIEAGEEEGVEGEADTAAAQVETSEEIAQAEKDTAADTTEEDILAELMGESLQDTLDFGFDEELEGSADQFPFSSRLELSLYNSRTSTNWPGFTVNKRDRQKIDKWLNMPEVQRLIPVDVEWAWSTR